MTNKHNRNYQRIDNAIVNAYKEILKEKGNSDASITELCKRAGVNRTTFYKHYRGIYEITDSVESQLIYNLFNLEPGGDLKMESFLLNPRPTLDTFNNNLMQNLDYYKHALRPERLHYIVDRSVKILLEDFKQHFPKYAKREDLVKKTKINITDLVGSFSTLYIQWLNGHLNCELSDLTEYMCKTIPALYKDAKMPE